MADALTLVKFGRYCEFATGILGQGNFEVLIRGGDLSHSTPF
jgi:hypothetical protein